ncbi:MAG: hypothetical protein ACR2QJ_01310, partial [Geminicoccaceae bacterium]
MTDRGNPGPTDAGSNDRANPYVGPRPFEEAERHLFYGRDRDARRLTDTIVSAPFSILYAQSGLGKTSLLRTRVIPKLREEEDCRVFFFDNWRDERP